MFVGGRAADWGYARRGVGGGKVEENGHACLYIAAPAKGVCGDAKKATPLADCSLTYPPVCIAAPAKKRAGELKTPPAIPTACQPTCPCAEGWEGRHGPWVCGGIRAGIPLSSV